MLFNPAAPSRRLTPSQAASLASSASARPPSTGAAAERAATAAKQEKHKYGVDRKIRAKGNRRGKKRERKKRNIHTAAEKHGVQF